MSKPAMIKKDISLVDPLDIWGIITDHINFDESNPVEEAFLKLNVVEEGSYVNVHYYNETEPERKLVEHPKTATFHLTSEVVDKMYRDIRGLVNLPETIRELSVLLKPGNIVYFDIKMVPLMKI